MHGDFRYDSEISVIAKIEIFAMHSNFRYDSEISLSVIAKFWYCSSLATVPLLPVAFIHTTLFHFFLL